MVSSPGTPLQYSCLENPMDGGAWWAAVHGVSKSQTRLSDFTFTFHVHPLEKEMATHSSVLAWRIPGTGEPGRLLSMGLHRVGHDWSDLAAAEAAVSNNGEGNGNPLQCSCLDNPKDGGAWWAAVVYGVAQSWTRLKRLSSSSSSNHIISLSLGLGFPINERRVFNKVILILVVYLALAYVLSHLIPLK